jgi:CubicO group peptidase (beta-lactamase class C family)
MYSQIYKTPRSEKGFKYSDLCFYFTKKIVEQLIGESQHTYLLKNIYQPMGLKTLTYLPLESFSKDRITPTEKDTYFRNQLVHGYVHDQGAAMLGGVAGHAGLFSNAYDLANIMQLFLRKGNYGGKQYFSSATMDEYNKAQFPGNRRGAGFDRPKLSGGGTCDELASQQSFGHSGFTGTLAWADPKDNVIFIFLSNRVNPSAENWKIRDLNIRTNIQHIVYEAVNNRKKND